MLLRASHGRGRRPWFDPARGAAVPWSVGQAAIRARPQRMAAISLVHDVSGCRILLDARRDSVSLTTVIAVPSRKPLKVRKTPSSPVAVQGPWSSREQAHLPAEQPSPGQDPRLPAAHAHARRPFDSGCAAPQGSRGDLGLSEPSRDGFRPNSCARPDPVLPAEHRMRRHDDFARVIRDGRRAGQPRVVVHLVARPGCDAPALVGLVVSKAVGNSVVRHRVSRSLRHQMRPKLDRLPRGSMLVLRARPEAADATSGDLGADLERALDRLVESPGAAPR